MKNLVLTASFCSLLLACGGTPCSGGGPKSAQSASVHAVGEAPSAPTSDAIASSVPLMPHAVTSFGAVALDGAVYALGGYAGVPHAYSREGQTGDLYKLVLNAEDPLKAWSLLPASEAAQGTPLSVLRGQLVSAGGMQALNATGEPEHLVSLSTVRAFDPATRTWRTLEALPEARSSHALVAHDDTLFVVGGWTLSGDRKAGKFASSGFVYDAAAGTWKELPQPFRLRALAAAMLDGKLVVLGGMDENARTSQAVHVYDPERQSWSRGPDLPSDGFGIAATSNGDTLFASARDGVLYALDDVASPFRAAQRLAFPRFFHQLVMADANHVVALGGISGMHFGARIRPVEIVDVQQRGPRVLSFTLTNPLSGKNRQGFFAAGDSLYVFGGNRSLNQHDFAPEDFSADAGRLDLSGMFWERLPDFPRPRQTMQTWVEEERALVLGGFGFDDLLARGAVGEGGEGAQAPENAEARAQADAFVFNFEQENWQTSPQRLDKPRTQFGLVGEGDALWIFGGLDYDPARVAAQKVASERNTDPAFQHPRAVLRAHGAGPFHETGIELPQPRRAFGGEKLKGHYYMVGGMADGFAPVASCDVFAFATQTFAQFPCPNVRISPQLVALHGKLYLAGGSTPGAQGLVENPSLEVFDPETQTWSTVLETLPISPRHLSMAALGGSLVLYSAHNEQGVANVALIVPE